jgi:hypothetical protein
MATIDNESEPGSWKREMEKMPWRFKHSNYVTVNDVLAAIRANGFFTEANFIAEEIQRYRTQIQLLEDKLRE